MEVKRWDESSLSWIGRFDLVLQANKIGARGWRISTQLMGPMAEDPWVEWGLRSHKFKKKYKTVRIRIENK